jgi:cyclohexanone monooxygenase
MSKNDRVDTTELDALIVGAGFAGLYMLHKLRLAGLRVSAVEAGEGVGGTWYWNRYPGARCDVPSIEYSYSFSAELESEWIWSERYAAQPEIERYLNHVADRFGLRQHIRFNTRVKEAIFDEDDHRWRISTEQGAEFVARYLVLATGNLSAPKLPDWPGLDRFKGEILHTAQWPREADLADRRVALVGTGSSGVQVIPQIAAVARSLTVFQRTPSFVVPASNRPLTREEQQPAEPGWSQQREDARQSFLGFFAKPIAKCAAKTADPDERSRVFEESWRAGTSGLLLAFEDLLVDEESNALAADFARKKIAALVRDPETRRRLTPHGYPIGARRLVSEIGFFDAMNRSNVSLVDVREEPVVEVTEHAVVTTKQPYEIDVLVFATGFYAMTGALAAINVKGRGGRALKDEWADGPRAYLGLSVAGFPNMFMVTGPGSPGVLSNVVVSIEQHVDWIAECLRELHRQDASAIEASETAESQWMHEVDAVAQKTLFPKANSWYQGRTRAGKSVFMPYVGGVGTYREICRNIAGAGYEGFIISKNPSSRRADPASVPVRERDG